jgi:hypothetical protein
MQLVQGNFREPGKLMQKLRRDFGEPWEALQLRQ